MPIPQTLVNDTGRSYLVKKVVNFFGLIQQIHNYFCQHAFSKYWKK